MPDFVQIGLPSSTASSMEIGSTLIPDQVDWGVDLLNQRYVQTVQAQGGIQAVELAPNRKITLPFIYKGSSPDIANQYISALQSVTQPGNILDIRPEGASWITRFDIEGGRVLAHRDIRYHRQGIIQGTLELSTRPWGYTPTWMIAGSVASIGNFVPFAGSVIGDVPAYSRWTVYVKPHASSAYSVGGLILGQHQMPSYRTIWGGQALTGASVGVETLGGTPSLSTVQNSQWGAINSFPFVAMNTGGNAELQNMASSTRIFVSAYVQQASVAGGFGLTLTFAGRNLSRPAFLVKPLLSKAGGGQALPQLLDFGEINRQLLITPDAGVATQIKLDVRTVVDTTVSSNATVGMYIDSMVAIPNAGVFVVVNPLNVSGIPGDVWGTIFSATYIIQIDSKMQRMWRTLNGGSAMSNELTPNVRGQWPLLTPNSPSGGQGFVMGILSPDSVDVVGIPFASPSAMTNVSVQYQPRWTLFR